MSDFLMPTLGAGMEVGTVVTWARAPGDPVRRGDVIAEVETEKGLIEIEVFEDGVVDALLVAEGTKVAVGTPIARIRSSAEEAPPVEPPRAPTPAAPRATAGARQLAHEASVDLRAVTPTGRHGTITRADIAHAAAPVVPPAEAARRASMTEPSRPMPPARAKISPLARRRAAELGVDLARVTPDGTDGAIHARDVERAPRATADEGAGMRRAIAAAMTKSKREIPHYYAATTIDLGAALAWLEETNAARPVTERLLPAVLLLRAVVLALRKVPELNAHWTGDAAPAKPEVHLGVAIALRRGGLIAPAILDADRMSLDALMTGLGDLVQRARGGGLRGSELTSPTITVTSLGDRGVETVFPIIHPPQVAMVGFGKIVRRPWVIGGELGVRPVVTATLAGDHRVSDGHRGGLFLAAIDAALQHPEGLR